MKILKSKGSDIGPCEIPLASSLQSLNAGPILNLSVQFVRELYALLTKTASLKFS